MPRYLTLAVAQMGPIPRSQSRAEVVARLVALLREADRLGAELVTFPECALGAFFPHWWIEDEAELNSHFESEMPNPTVQPLFDEAARRKIGFYLGYAELAFEAGKPHRFNSSLLVDRDGSLVGRYRKIHLPGHCDHRPGNPFQNLEKRYFEVGDLGFRAWPCFGGVGGMLICNDRRWPEAWRVLGLAGAEFVLLGYNTPNHFPEHPDLDRLTDFHHLLSLQAGAYQNGLWVAAAAKAGTEEGVTQIGQSAIVAPSGEVVARSTTLDDEVIVHRADLDMTRSYKQGVWNFATNRRVDYYGAITDRPNN